ncbi:copper resistance CopC family protein [Actinokineospora pegani]|uniref:copper resistance CopC family protein n=1 Tax=Actinokineospora pegani TaxID=2654637 RepID=UPI0012EA539A|nr:copper resistance CopC family protein [Actinokineospora pegani]
MRILGRALVTALVALFALVGLAGTALAHNQLVGSTPAQNATLETGPASIELTFDQPVQAGKDLNTIVVVGPDGTSQWQDGTAVVKSNVVSVPLRDLGPAGVYNVGYRILSADGHSVSGQLPFTLTKAGTGTPSDQPLNASAPAADDSTSAAAPQNANDEGVPIWVWIVGAVVLLGGGVLLAAKVGGSEQ